MISPLGMLFRAAYLAPLFCITLSAFAEDGEVRPVFGAHHGYLDDVNEEKTKREMEMVMLPKPKDTRPPLDKVIFNEKLTKEFQAQYQYRFGTSQAEQTINTATRDGEFTYYNRPSITIQEYRTQQKKFGDYMNRRLTEYHVDAWAKNDPDFRPVYKMKDKISNLDVQVKKGYKMKWKYNFAGPSMEVVVENPYDIETKVQAMMNGVLSKPNEMIYSVGYKLTPRVKVETLYREVHTLQQLVISRRMTRHITLSLTGSNGELPTYPDVKQTMTLVGVAYSE